MFYIFNTVLLVRQLLKESVPLGVPEIFHLLLKNPVYVKSREFSKINSNTI